ncbi:hypothetical protein M2427_004147 [Bradyrhizobium sp. BR13661]|jgi:hypothetical protein|nr:hypothetical protein [Bradyrhizobium sp. BR13661]
MRADSPLFGLNRGPFPENIPQTRRHLIPVMAGLTSCRQVKGETIKRERERRE